MVVLKKGYQTGQRLLRRMTAVDVFGLAAQLAYFFLLSLFPFLLFLVTLLGYLPIDEAMVMGFISIYAPAEISQLIETNLSNLVHAQRGSLLSIGIIGTLWSASNGLNAITKAFNRAYDVDENRSFLVARLIAMVMTIAMVGVIAMAFLLPIFGEMIGIYIFSFLGMSEEFISFWNTSRWILSSVVFFIVLLALYVLMPNKKIHIKDAFFEAIFATIGWQTVSLGFSYYVQTISDYSATYGSLGAVIILMIWFYISGIIIITGGVINAMITDQRQKRDTKIST